MSRSREALLFCGSAGSTAIGASSYKLQAARKIKGQSGRGRQREGFLWESACRRRFWVFACKHAPTMSRSREALLFCGIAGSTAIGALSYQLQAARKIKGQSGRGRLRLGFLWESACRRGFWLFACKHAPTMSRSREALLFCGSAGSTAIGAASYKLQAARKIKGQTWGPAKGELFGGVCLQTKVLVIRVQAGSHNGPVDGMVALFPYTNIESITPSYISFSL